MGICYVLFSQKTTGEREIEMIQKLLCWLFGHKTVYKAFTGQTVAVDGHFDRNITTPVMTWERSKFCLRCGEKVHQD